MVEPELWFQSWAIGYPCHFSWTFPLFTFVTVVIGTAAAPFSHQVQPGLD